MNVDLIAWIRVLALIVGSLAAVIVAHDRALDRSDGLVAWRSQLVAVFVIAVDASVGFWLLIDA